MEQKTAVANFYESVIKSTAQYLREEKNLDQEFLADVLDAAVSKVETGSSEAMIKAFSRGDKELEELMKSTKVF